MLNDSKVNEANAAAPETQPRIDSISIVIAFDESPDTSTIGEYTDEKSDWAIERSSGEYVANLPEDAEIPERSMECRFFVPYAGGEVAGSKDYQEYGKQDFKRMESLHRGDWQYVCIYAKAEASYAIGQGNRRLECLRSGGLCGVESDSGDYLKEIMQDELADLRVHLEAFNVEYKQPG